MIKQLTPEFRGPYRNLIDYAKYLTKSICADNLICLTTNFSIENIVLKSLFHPFKAYTQSSVEAVLKKIKLDGYRNNVLVVDLDSINLNQDDFNEFAKLPFVIYISTKKIAKNIIKQNSNALSFDEGRFNCLLSGAYAQYKESVKKNILAIISTYNEEDIIEQVVEHLINQNVDIYLIDNWSTDNTYKILTSLQQKYSKRIKLERFPESGSTPFYEWKNILKRKVEIAAENNYDWYIHYDADEIRVSPWINLNLQDSISFVDSLGFNAIEFTVINFKPTKDGFSIHDDPANFFTHFEFGKTAGDLLQIKAWKNLNKKVDLDFHFGHNVLFENRKVYPLKFLLKHYSLRSELQANKKIFVDRTPRYTVEEKAWGAHVHYNKIENTSILVLKEDYLEYKNDSDFYKKYFVEATSRKKIKIDGKVAVILGFVKPANETLLIEAIKRLKEQSYRLFDIYVYDNSVIENSLENTKKLFPDVYIKKNEVNCGFAGGNNSVMREVLQSGMYDYVALINDDTQPSSVWLESLVEMAKSNENAGAVTSKLIFYEPFVRLECFTQTFNPKSIGLSSDDRDLGVQLFPGETRFENTHYSKKFLREGLYGYEGMFTWTKDKFIIDVPVGLEFNQQNYILNLVVSGADQVKNQTIIIHLGNFKASLEITPGKSEYKISIPKNIIDESKFNLIQNAGSGITAQFNGYDIGSLNGDAEIDKGQYDSVREVEMICGGAVLFKADVLRKVGIFDEYFFVYYEDSDLSLRIGRAKYKLMYQPKALVRHIHAGSSTEYSPLFTYHVWKNKPAFVIKNFGVKPSIFALKELTKILFIESKNVLKNKFRSGYHNSRLKVILRSSVKFYSNLPLILLKKFNIIKSI